MFMPYMQTDLGHYHKYWDITLVPEAAKKELLKIGLEPYILFMHYVDEVHRAIPDVSFERAAECLIFSLDQVEKAHALLVKNGWVSLNVYKSSKKADPPIDMFALGFNSVYTLQKGSDSRRYEFNFKGKRFEDDQDDLGMSEE